MDTFFLSQRLLTIARHRYQSIWLKKERQYYYRYMLKLSYNLEYLGAKTAVEALEYLNKFENNQSKRVKNGVMIKPKKMLELACKDARDVLQGMKRWDGVGIENWNCFGMDWKVDFSKGVL